MTTPQLAFLFVLAVLLGGMGSQCARAHDGYGEWTDSRGYSCCDNRDCQPVRADLTPGGWQIWIEGRWVVVPADAVLKIPSPDGRSHACMTPGAIEPRCFVAGEVRG